MSAGRATATGLCEGTASCLVEARSPARKGGVVHTNKDIDYDMIFDSETNTNRFIEVSIRFCKLG